MIEFTKARKAIEGMRKISTDDFKDIAFAQVQLAIAEGLNQIADAIISKDIGVHRGELNIRHRSGG